MVAPPETSSVRVLDLGNSGGETIDPLDTGEGIVRPARYLLEVTLRHRGRRVVRRFPVTIRVTERGPVLPGLP